MFAIAVVTLGFSSMDIPRLQGNPAPRIMPIDDALTRYAKMVLEKGPERIAFYQTMILRYMDDPNRQHVVYKYHLWIKKQEEEIERAKKILGKK